MDPGWVREREARCTQEQPPACTATCPIHLDARALIDRVRQGDLAGGLAVLARHVPFPRIIARTCDRPCEAPCRRGDAGEPVRIGSLERACAELGGPLPPRARFPARPRHVAVVGGGLSGLTVAVELAARGNAVEVFEARPVLLSRIRQLGSVPAEAIEADLAVLPLLGVAAHLGTRVAPTAPTTLAEVVSGFDAVYLGIGAEKAGDLSVEILAQPDGRMEIAPVTFATSQVKVFAGGSHRHAALGFSTLRSLHDGLCAANSIDRFLQGASLTARRENEGPFPTRLHVETRGLTASPAVAPADPAHGYSAEEAAREAARCLPCQCLECVKGCEYLAHYGSYPRRYIREIYNNDCIVMGAHTANRMVNSCTLCGLCEILCPEDLAMGEVCLEARRSLVAKGKMPPSAHELPLRDMEFSLGEAFALCRHEPGQERSAALFFPGCQLAGSSPDHVVAAYEQLRAQIAGGVGLLLGCCGAPARWAGREEAFRSVLRRVEESWDEMGRPRIITACSACQRLFREMLPHLPVEALWSVLDPPAAPLTGPARRLAVHDPCTSRGDAEVQDGVRRLLARLGVEALELNERDRTTCCGFGGLVRFANPALAEKIVRRRASQSEDDYVTYCAMCRDSLAREGKRALHLLDLLFPAGQDPASRPDPGISRRQENRARLKERLLRELWSEGAGEKGPPMRLDVSPEVLERMERRMILLEDVRKVIEHAESTGQKLEDVTAGRFLASHRPATVTYWVEYSVVPGGFAVHDAYSHRMEVS
ncbi:MAG TPA: heterodisulfide reductase-related iron-sulfur binding cluster [Anaeromyxobacter sp.]|nr:heterodisulfide reductase-related iron-sulfur binding cluster [Anaeromyxobacter sp.]